MLVCASTTIIAHETAGASGARHSPRPLIEEGGKFLAKLGRSAPRECGGVGAAVDGVTGPGSALQASRACYGAVDGALRAACLEGGRSSLTFCLLYTSPSPRDGLL